MTSAPGAQSPRLTDALRQLSPDRFVSGEVLARHLKCSRATVHNILATAAAAGVNIYAIRGRGYRLARPMSWLQADRLQARLAEQGLQLRFHDVLDSTSSELLRAAQDGAAHRSVTLTEWQTAGRGRRGRHWLGALGNGLSFSLLWRSEHGAAALSGLSLAVGALLVQALRSLGLSQAAVKWPNDILVNGAKLAGVLIELNGDMQGPSAAVIGIGVNVRGGEALSASVGQAVTDVSTHLGEVDRNDLFLALVATLDAGLARFEQHGFAAYIDTWQDCHAFQGREVTVVDAQGRAIAGRVLGVDMNGALRLHCGDAERTFYSGEVSLRGVLA